MTRFKIGNLNRTPFQWEWIEKKAINHLKALHYYCDDNLRLYDSDNDGEETLYIAVGLDGEFKFFKVKHGWEWLLPKDEESFLQNFFEYQEVDKAEAQSHADCWMIV
jgi:hypothetical protein